MLEKMLTEQVVALDVEAATPQEAIEAAGQLLVKAGHVKPSYVKAMIRAFEDIGPYIVLAPGIAIPHARPENGVIRRCVSFMSLKQPVVFGHPTNDPVEIVCAIGGTDNTGHIEMLQSLSVLLGNKAKVEQLQAVKTYAKFIETIKE